MLLHGIRLLSLSALVSAMSLLSLSALLQYTAAEFQASADAQQYLSEDFFPGMHLLDLAGVASGELVAYKGGQLPGMPEPLFRRFKPITVSLPGTLPELLAKLEVALEIPEREELQNPRAFFDRQGGAIQDIEALKNAAGPAFLIEVGVWIWPPVRVGFTQEATDVGGKTVTLKTLALRPKVFEVRNFITVAETETVMELGQKQGLHNSKGQMQSADIEKGTADASFRTSKQAWLDPGLDPVIKTLDVRVAGLTRVPESHQEPAQLLRYDSGTYYHNHMDWGELELYPDQKAMWVDGHMGHQDRLATVFWYLNDVPEGGETNFPKHGQKICSPLSRGGPSVRHCSGTYDPPPAQCKVGLKVKPERGSVVMWYNYHANGRGDVNALHAGCPVGKDLVKWSANKWVRLKPMRARGRWIEGHPAIERHQWKGEAAAPDPNACSFTVDSEYAEATHIYWQGAQAADLGTLDALGTRTMNSFRGHKFFIQAGDRKTKVVTCKPPQTSVRLTAEFTLEEKKKKARKEL